IPLPDPFDGNPRHLKEFLTDLDLCFRASPSKYATDNIKIMVAGRLCSNRKVSPWRNTWLQRWKQHEEGYKSWEDFERGMRYEFGDHLEKKDARTKFKRTSRRGSCVSTSHSCKASTWTQATMRKSSGRPCT